MSLSRRQEAKLVPLFQEDLENRSDVVTYSSVNEAENRSFKAVSPPNSQHAAKLAQLAIAIQSKEKPEPRPNKWSRYLPQPVSRLLLGDGHEEASSQPAPRHTVATQQYLSYQSSDGQQADFPEAGPHHRRAQMPSMPRHERQPVDQQRHQQWTPQQTQQYATAQSYHQQTYYPNHSHTGYTHQETDYIAHRGPDTDATAVGVVVQRSRDASDKEIPRVTRHRTEDRTAYKVSRGGGSMQVSAPLGSSEAGLFDAIAEAHSARQDGEVVQDRNSKSLRRSRLS
ncbi:uncharacterized protein E0L32_002455 [Thyridium curvatum]|uniref:Uncharacterized protein n=1 Tax=Thyridium curvatum TaxID=1093900 RepID=A0A507BP70_9PEZI|nr:uncharacterized protein E0L32_002455 [Thyridium curvatum]TPX18598.1 hypothetical protein E0L32_002455 [Thyridium curvatum]